MTDLSRSEAMDDLGSHPMPDIKAAAEIVEAIKLAILRAVIGRDLRIVEKAHDQAEEATRAVLKLRPLIEEQARACPGYVAADAETKAEVVRVAFRTFNTATEKGYDAGEVIALVVDTIRPIIEEQARQSEREAIIEVLDARCRENTYNSDYAAGSRLEDLSIIEVIRSRSSAPGEAKT